MYKLLIALIVLLMMLLSSCSTKMVKRDGPPPFHVDETKIPNAVPKPEKLAKYGNMPSYKVFGKRYYTLRSSKNYEAVGTASWYGTQFHERNTSSGEPYDMLAMTAAHKTLPLPTYVEVTNLTNRRQIIVKVNDRGPFSSNRLIDLSYVAAKKLGMLGRGTAQVRIRAIDPTRSYQIVSKQVYLQAGAFKNKTHAEKLRLRLIALLNAPVKVSKGRLYRVEIGPLRDIATANKITSRLRKIGIKPNKLVGV
jgi:rare lipoprotein A